MRTITAAEKERIDQAYATLDALCKKYQVEVRANDKQEYWFECTEYNEPEKPELKVVS